MMGATPRLGDLIDDHCPRCKLLLNHAIASMMEGKVAKVICQTCLTEHAYLYQDGAKRKKPPGGRETLFDQVLSHGDGLAQAEEGHIRKKKASPTSKSGRGHKGKSQTSE